MEEMERRNLRLKTILFLATVVFIGTGTSVLAEKGVIDHSIDGYHVKRSTSDI